MRISDWSSDVCSSDLPSRLPTTPLQLSLGRQAAKASYFEIALSHQNQLFRHARMQRHSVIEGLFGETRFHRDRRCLKNFRRIWSNHGASHHFTRFDIANTLDNYALIASGKEIFKQGIDTGQ